MKRLAVILAGGRGTRLGGCEKPFLPLGETTLIGSLIDRLSGQVDDIALSVRSNQQHYSSNGLVLLEDRLRDIGPLSGILSALHWAKKHGAHVLTVPGDTPFIPRTLFQNLMPGPSYASCMGQKHYLTAIWPVSCIELLEAYVAAARKADTPASFSIRHFTTILAARDVDFEESQADAFFNINTFQDYQRARDVLRREQTI